jgi:hypothetical protein
MATRVSGITGTPGFSSTSCGPAAAEVTRASPTAEVGRTATPHKIIAAARVVPAPALDDFPAAACEGHDQSDVHKFQATPPFKFTRVVVERESK